MQPPVPASKRSCVRAHGELDAGRKWKRKTLRSRSQQLKPAALAKPTEEDESGGETNAIRVDQQPELMEIKEQRRGDGAHHRLRVTK
ncbi:Hypothetical protein SMAX5B_017724 [Scophthalmus maximus]|uniref:Uncharacterized protein n=1 Tax=Scophthalmus maximus TaxID=52904 RepID=A0A2U9CG22_SCOMX|nr:Hypothetical protein SMAX5B_017724 [Scophthalmus maximus]